MTRDVYLQHDLKNKAKVERNTERFIKIFTAQSFHFASRKYYFLSVDVRRIERERRGYNKIVYY